MKKEYRFEVYTDYSSGSKQYIVNYFDFPNIIGVGDTVDEALEEAEGNLDYYLEYCSDKGIAIPEPSLHEVNNFSGKVTLRMSKTLHKKVDAQAKKEGVSINSFICEAVSNYIGGKTVINNLTEGAIDGIATVANEYLSEIYKNRQEESFFEKYNRPHKNKEMVV